MSYGATALHSHTVKAGTCPHGLPLGACPICNGMAGGNATSKRDTPRNVGEMSYNQCAAIGAMLKAQRLAKKQAQMAQQNHLQAIANFQKSIANVHQKIMELSTIISKTTPTIIAKPLNFVLNNIVGKTLTLIQNLPNAIINLSQVISQKFVDITDKLTAIYGEMKTAVQKKVSEVLSNVKKKLKSIFFIFGADEVKDDDKKIDEAKRTFELKTFIHKLYKRIKGEQEKDTENNAH